jgi:hypothetical protein
MLDDKKMFLTLYCRGKVHADLYVIQFFENISFYYIKKTGIEGLW